MASIVIAEDIRREPLAESLREAIRASGRSLTGLAKEAGVDDGNLSRFMRGERDLKLASVDQLAGVLGLALVPASPRPRRRGVHDGRGEG